MPEYSRSLGDAVKRAREKLGLTQNEVADTAKSVPAALRDQNATPIE